MPDSDHAQNNGIHHIRRSLSGNGVPTRPSIHIGPTSSSSFNEDYSFGSPRRKSHKKSPSVFKVIDDAAAFAANTNGGDPKQVTANNTTQRDPASTATNGSTGDVGQPNIPSTAGVRPHVAAPSTVSNLTALSKATNESGSSSGSGSTVRNSSMSRRDDSATVGKTRSKQRRISMKRPNALSFLDSDSPDLTPEAIHHSIETGIPTRHESPLSPQSTSPSNRSITSATTSSSSFLDDAASDEAVNGDHETDRSSSPERSINGEDKNPMQRTPVAAARIDPKHAGSGGGGGVRRRSYGTPPDLPYAVVNQPPPYIPMSMSPNALTPRAPNQGPFTFPPPPPPPQRPDRGPLLTGYELIASRLCTTATPAGDHSISGPQLKPLYRRFEALHHRVLLHLQDEICELEEQLHRLDSSDTQSRRLLQQGGCIPASRRAEQHSTSEMHWHRLDVLSKIAFKLDQYNNVLSSHRKTQFFPRASPPDVREYRHFLATAAPVVEAETHFLDVADDLVCVNHEYEEEESDDDDDSSEEASDEGDEDDDALATPMPHSNGGFSLRGSGSGSGSKLDKLGEIKAKQLLQQQRPPPPPAPSSPQKSKQSLSDCYHDADNKINGHTNASVITGTGTSQPTLLLSISLAITGAILLPVLAFAAIPGYIGRMAVVFVVLVGVVGALLQQGELIGLGSGSGNGSGGASGYGRTMDVLVCAGCYGVVMAVLAGVMG